MHFTGASQDGWSMEGQFSEADIVAWPGDGLPLDNVSVFCNENTFTAGADGNSFLNFESAEIFGGSATTTTLSPIFDGNLGITFTNFTKINKQSPGYFKGEFSGQCKTGNGLYLQITNGKFKLITPWPS